MTYSTRNKIGLSVLVISFVATTVAILTPFWLQNRVDSTFAKMGLWVKCAPGEYQDEYRIKYNKAEFWEDECSWIVLPVQYPWLFFAIQISYTGSWIILIFTGAKLAWTILCSGNRTYEAKPMQRTAVFLLFSGFLGAIGIVIFFTMCERWTPKSRDNFISWSFWLGTLGALGQIGASLIFMT